MSLFRKPKKIQKRVFTARDNDDDDEENSGNYSGAEIERWPSRDKEADEDLLSDRKRTSKDASQNTSGKSKSAKDTKSLLSFADEGKFFAYLVEKYKINKDI